MFHLLKLLEAGLTVIVLFLVHWIVVYLVTVYYRLVQSSSL